MKITEDILNYLKKIKKPSSTHDIAKSIKRPWHSVQNRLLKLKLEGKVKSHKFKRINIWRLDEGKTKKKSYIIKKSHLKKISKERRKAKEILERSAIPTKESKGRYFWTGIKGLDKLLHCGMPKGNSNIIAGGTGSGKTILCLQIMYQALKEGKNCLFMTLEESEERLITHMADFGWNVKQYVKNKKLMIYRINPFDLKRSIDALLAQAKGELLIHVDAVVLPKQFKPDFVFVDSLTAIAAAFTGKQDTYRIYIEQFFRYLETTGATSFLISETDQIPTKFSPTGIEEFLADGVIVLYSIGTKKERIRAIEILKLRGAGHQRKIVKFVINDTKGIEIYPDEEIFVDV